MLALPDGVMDDVNGLFDVGAMVGAIVDSTSFKEYMPPPQ
jgi:hypothetical protein